MNLKRDDFDLSQFNIMLVMEEDIKTNLNNKLNYKLPINDWGKILANTNQAIQKMILRTLLPTSFSVYDCNDDDLPLKLKDKVKNNSPGFDLIVIDTETDKEYRIQSKLRQVAGQAPFSRQISLETTRRHSIKNINLNSRGHTCYGLDEFDFLLISLIHYPSKDLEEIWDIRRDCNKWKFCLIPVNKLLNEGKNGLITAIPPSTLEESQLSDMVPIFYNKLKDELKENLE